MRAFSMILILLSLAVFACGQERASTQNVPKVDAENSERLKWDLDKLLQPESSDLAEAKKLGVEVFRILPRETYDGKIAIHGGGAYYSFVQKYGYITPLPDQPNLLSFAPVGNNPPAKGRTVEKLPEHYYGYGSDIELQLGNFGVGFAGLSYGFLYDLGDIPLEAVSKEIPQAVFLTSYAPPLKTSEIRAEQGKARAYEANSYIYKNSVPAAVGHTYLLRSINFRNSDIVVALKVHRQDMDGSMIVFWKKLKTFDAPQVEKDF